MTSSTVPLAWDDPATRRAWRAALLLQLAGALFALILFPAGLFATALTPSWFVPLWLVLVILIGLHIHHRLEQLINLVRILRVLKGYAWSTAVAHPAGKSDCRFEAANPDNPARHLSVRLRTPFGGSLTYWARWCRSHDGEKVRFCGDIRFIGVVAHHRAGKGRLRLVSQPEAINRRMSPRRKGVSQEARERALAVGARVG
ncbi:hypothetical protein ABZW18_10680 [Streptomyces sp. NPDC004647]|uniref:hypothetical protein n=1 Tax=Streptomyces sp. NPDC004647 TaxID=3154671 RepID=UPI0033B233C5